MVMYKVYERVSSVMTCVPWVRATLREFLATVFTCLSFLLCVTRYNTMEAISVLRYNKVKWSYGTSSIHSKVEKQIGYSLHGE